MAWKPGRARALAFLPALFVALCLVLSCAWFLPGVRAAVGARGACRAARGPGEGRPRLVIRRWTVSKALITPEETVTIRITVANEGGGTLHGVRLQAEATEGLEIISESLPKETDLGAGEQLSGV